jgi:hypothetical protein
MTYADIHAEALARAGWSHGFTTYVDREGRKIVVADAHKDGVRFIVHAECLATAMLELKTQALRTVNADQGHRQDRTQG